MKSSTYSFYPTFWQGANLIVLYIFIQACIDFPLALYDYQNGTDMLYEPWIKVPVFFISTLAILYLGYRFSDLAFEKIFPFKGFNFLLIFAMVLTFEGLQYFLTEINIRFEKILPPPAWFMELFSRLFDSDLGIWGGIMRVVIIAPIVEEAIFRGVIMSGFMRNYRPAWAIFYSALLFALFHLNPWQFPSAFLLGLILGWLRIQSGSILACITGHAIHNGLVFLTVHFYLQLSDISLLEPEKRVNYFIQGMILLAGLTLIFFITQIEKRNQTYKDLGTGV